MDLMWEHFLLDNPPVEDKDDTKYRDPDYDKEERLAEGREGEEPTEEGRLPIQDFESYKDHDFDAEWNRTDEDEIPDSDSVSENTPEDEFLNFDEGQVDDPKQDIAIKEQWEEV